MRHNKAFRKLGRNPSHRRALLRNLATSLILNDRIETTVPRAKELRSVADKLVTLAKNDTLHARRQAMSFLFPINRTEKGGDSHKLSAVHRLFSEVAPRYVERNGGYTRVLRTRRRLGDQAELAIIEFVEKEMREKSRRRKRRVVRASVDDKPAEEGTDSAADEAPSEEVQEASESSSSDVNSANAEQSFSADESVTDDGGTK